jgi:hypothetical protein
MGPGVVALVTLVAWFCLANHCVLDLSLASAEEPMAAETNGCPMHSAPAKKKPAAKLPCCKEVRAVLAKGATKAMPFSARLAIPCEYAVNIFGLPPRVTLEIHGFDTGPPGCFSFAELVLQESMRAHAPPVS